MIARLFSQTCGVVVFACPVFVPHAGLGATFKSLHSFDDGPTGGEPLSQLTLYNGSLYGTTALGGTSGPPTARCSHTT